MKFLRNAGAERTLDLIKPLLKHGNRMDMASASLSLFAFAELINELSSISKARLLLPSDEHDLQLFFKEPGASCTQDGQVGINKMAELKGCS